MQESDTDKSKSNPKTKSIYQLASDDVKEYKAHASQKEVSFTPCKHSGVKFIDGKLICTCGAGWSGPNLHQLMQNLQT